MKVEVKGESLVITLPIRKEKSKSGKTTLVASTHGNLASSAQVDGFPVVVSVNAYIKA